VRYNCCGDSRSAEDGIEVTHRFPALIAAPAPARGRLWLTGARLFDGTSPWLARLSSIKAPNELA